ncbi:MAG: serine hydrolase domain-containing protein [Pseudomonadota bacterium]
MTDQVAATVQRYVDSERFAGIEWAVDVARETVSAGQVGLADVGQGKPIPESALYRIYSMTKPIVSVLALKLIDQGKLRLYDMLPQFDPRFAQLRVLTPDGSIVPAQRPITVEDLITHRAGFTYEFIHGCHIAQYYREAQIIADGRRSLDDMMGALAEQPLAFQPGSMFRYSVCIDVLAHVCQRAADKPLDQLLNEEIFAPLGMMETSFCVAADEQSRVMSMYGVGDLQGLPPLDITPQTLEPMDVEEMYPLDHADFQRGGHGLYSTLADYQKFARMLLNGRGADDQVILSSAMHRALQVNRIPAHQLPLRIGPNVLAGYGWGLVGRVMMDSGQGLSLTGDGEFGWAGAASTYFWVDPARQMTGVLMSQYLGASMPLSDDVRTAAYQLL